MTKMAALDSFFNEFGLPAYPVTSVPDNVAFPFLTYEAKVGEMGDPVNITVNLWYKTESEKIPNDKADEIYSAISDGGTLRSFDGGALWITRGAPWCQSLSDETDNTIKRRYINVNVEFLTE